MRTTRFRRQDGFFREIFWMAVIVAVVAVVLLDALALFNAHQSAHDEAAQAVREAQTEYAQAVSVAQAKAAAEQYLDKSGATMVSFESTGATGDSAMGFQVTAEYHAKTYAFRYLSYVPGLKKWVRQMTNPTGTESSE